MLDDKTYSLLREKLMDIRKDILVSRQSLNESLQDMVTPEIELEETASKVTISRTLETMADQTLISLEDIDNALSKMDKGKFGFCEICQKPIAANRLNAVPWARLCIRCARLRESFSTGGIDENAVKLNTTDLSDEEMEEAIWDALADEEAVDSEELDIHCEAGVVYLDGVVPAQSTRDILHHIIEDTLGFAEVVDNLEVDRTPWERQERTRKPTREKNEIDREIEGEYEEEDTHEALGAGKSLIPPDHLKPEK